MNVRKHPYVYEAKAGRKVFVWFEATSKGAIEIVPASDVVSEGDFVEF